jgi:hypothetical protein
MDWSRGDSQSLHVGHVLRAIDPHRSSVVHKFGVREDCRVVYFDLPKPRAPKSRILPPFKGLAHGFGLKSRGRLRCSDRTLANIYLCMGKKGKGLW